jgi:hypothetical protein
MARVFPFKRGAVDDMRTAGSSHWTLDKKEKLHVQIYIRTCSIAKTGDVVGSGSDSSENMFS